jgi:hypothetical protein
MDDLAMTIDECIDQFVTIMSAAFAKPRVVGALWRSKYSIEDFDAVMKPIIQEHSLGELVVGRQWYELYSEDLLLRLT